MTKKNETSETTAQCNIQNISGCCCVECGWKGDVADTNMDTYYDQFSGIDSSFPVCPKCGGTIRVD